MHYKLLNDIVQNAISLLNLVDTDEKSETYGCCYKPFWYGGQDPEIRNPNFVNARWQEAGLTLAMMWNKKYPRNPYFRNDEVKEIIKAIMLFWTKIQHRDGSFDEWKKYEHGQPPTAFSTYAMIKALEIMKDELSDGERKRIKKSIKKAADWLCVNSEPIAINHEVVAINTLYHAYLLLKDSKYLQAIDEKLEVVKGRFSEEGWFNEVGGPDTGYNEISLTYLGIYWDSSKDKRVLPIADKVLNFNKYFIYPDYISGGGINTRLATGTLPIGYAIFHNEFPLARELLLICIKSIVWESLKGVYSFTDYTRCVSLYLYLMLCDKLEKINLQFPFKYLPAFNSDDFIKIFNSGKIAVIKRPRYYLTIGKGGAIGSVFSYNSNCTVLYSSPINITNISGVFIELNNQRFLSNMYRKNKVSVERDSNTMKIKVQMCPFDINDMIWGPAENLKDWRIYLLHIMRELLPLNVSTKLYSKLLDMYHNYKLSGKNKENELIFSTFEREITFEDDSFFVSNKVSVSKSFLNCYVIEPFALIPKNIGNYKLFVNDAQYNIDCTTNLSFRDVNTIRLSYHNKSIITANLSEPLNCKFVVKEQSYNIYANLITLLWLIDISKTNKNRAEYKILI
ncbi:MAG: hypothetical protein ACTSUC_03275 [Promethearchaeota archaeon]